MVLRVRLSVRGASVLLRVLNVVFRVLGMFVFMLLSLFLVLSGFISSVLCNPKDDSRASVARCRLLLTLLLALSVGVAEGCGSIAGVGSGCSCGVRGLCSPVSSATGMFVLILGMLPTACSGASVAWWSI